MKQYTIFSDNIDEKYIFRTKFGRIYLSEILH